MVILLVVIVVLCICGIVFLLRKYIPGLKAEPEEKDEAQLIEEEVNRMIVNPEQENKKIEDEYDDDEE